LKRASAWHEREPRSLLSLVALGEALEASGDQAAAARAYGSIIDLFPSRADLRRYAGGHLERLSPRAGAALALDSYEKAREQRPDHPTSHRHYAMALAKRGRYQEAFGVLEGAVRRSYPSGRFVAAADVLRGDLGLVGAAWIAEKPANRAKVVERLKAAEASLADQPSIRFVLSWETDTNDVDLHVYDEQGHAYHGQTRLPSGGSLLADVTTGYGPEAFLIPTPVDQRPKRYRLQAHYFSRGPMGYGMGKLQIVEHDGKGRLTFDERPFVVMADDAYVDHGSLGPSLAPDARKPRPELSVR
jgi:tetratricopeptide (TPR) repeat protein